MIVIIDSMEFVKNPYFQGRKCNWLRDWKSCEDTKIVVPEIVMDEAATNFRKGIKDAAAMIDKGLKAMSRLLPRDAEWRFPPVCLDEEENRYRTTLSTRLTVLGIEQAGHNDIVLTARESRSVKGTIIWQMADEFLTHSQDTITIITESVRDFGKPGELRLIWLLTWKNA